MTSNGKQQRRFEISDAARTEVPLLVGAFGATHTGKPFSLLRLATGIQRVRGGRIVVIDTEARRALHYADKFTFRHMPFGAPFGPLDYLAACEDAVRDGASVIVIDSASHMHEGPGGMLEQHAANVQRMAGDDWKKAERVKMSAWIQPKQEFRRFVNSLLQMDVAILMAFRAKEKIKPVTGGQPQEQGWMPIISDELPYEMTINALLEPGCDGVPTWQPEHAASRGMVKLPQQFRDRFLNKKGPLDEDDGEYLARWAAGDAPTATRHGSTPPPAGPVFRWKSNAEWHGRPLTDAPLDVLREYRAMIGNALDTAKPAARATLDAMAQEAARAIEDAEADDAMNGVVDDGDDGFEQEQAANG